MNSNNQQKPTGKVKFDLDCSQTTDDADELFDGFAQPTSVSQRTSTSSIDSVGNGIKYEQKSTTKRYTRKMSGINVGSVGIRLANLSTPKDLCNLLGGTRIIQKVV